MTNQARIRLLQKEWYQRNREKILKKQKEQLLLRPKKNQPKFTITKKQVTLSFT